MLDPLLQFLTFPMLFLFRILKASAGLSLRRFQQSRKQRLLEDYS